MNIAIIIGVSEYKDVSNNLPGCKKDAEVVYNIILKSTKFDEVLYINEKLNSSQIKEKFTDFIATNKSQKIDELFFYYTGHGEFNDNEFYYLLSDFNRDKKKQTSLQNEEVDNLFKTLKPTLVVKVIDACQSGKAYIKEAGALSKYFQKTTNSYIKCYFLNSSLKDQSSFQNDQVSDFTLSFIRAIKEHETKEIRYKDIMDFISDEFEENTQQTPFFVIQADYTEKFCLINENLKDYLTSLDLISSDNQNGKQENLTLLDKIKNQASNYYGKEQTTALLLSIKEYINLYKPVDDLIDVFEEEICFLDNYDEVIQKNIIGKWLDDNQNDFFAKSSHKRVRKDRYTNPLGSLQSAWFIGGNAKDEDYEWTRNGFEIEVELPYKTIVITFNSQFPNVDSFTCRIVFFVSKSLIRFFYFTTNYETKNWDERKLNTKIEWLSMEFEIHEIEKIKQGLDKIFIQFNELIKKYLDDKFNKQDTSKE
nr:caspase family protein [uncultured Pedobacter sp.]